MIVDDFEYLSKLIRHIKNVQRAGIQLGRRLIVEEEKEVLGMALIANCMAHDNSKFESPEFEHLHDRVYKLSRADFDTAVRHHWDNNPHHPEYWDNKGGIDNMELVYIAEMVCDWYARSCEQGADFREWTWTICIRKFDITKDIHEKIIYFAKLLLEPVMRDFKKYVQKVEK